jgi:hypothetical protein
MRRILVIGDVHGCLDELHALLDAVEYRHGVDRLLFVGDLVDRGPDSVGCVAFVKSLGAACVLGNHEEWHIRWAKHEAKRRTNPNYKNPMTARTMELQEINAQLVADGHIEWLASLPLVIPISQRWVGVHAGFQPGVSIADQKPNIPPRIRYVDATTGKMIATPEIGKKPPGSVFWASVWTGPESVLYGHNVDNREHPRIDTPSPDITCVGLDTGCAFGGYLTCGILYESNQAMPEFVQVPARRQYAPFTADAE